MESAVSTLCFPWDKGLLDFRIHSLPEPLFGQSLSLNKHNCHGSLTLSQPTGGKWKGEDRPSPQQQGSAGLPKVPECGHGTARPQPHSSSHSSQRGTAGGNRAEAFTRRRMQTNLCCTPLPKGEPGLTRVHADPPERCTLSRSPPQPRQTTASVTSVPKAFLTQSSAG